MNRRTFLGTLAGALLGTPLTSCRDRSSDTAKAHQPPKTARIALVFANAPEATLTGPTPANPYAKAFLDALRTLGWVEGQNITIERRSAEGKSERVAMLIEQLRHVTLDVVVLSGGTEPAIRASGTVPIVLIGVDPTWLISAGLVESIAHPGGTVTGLTYNFGPDLLTKRLQLLKETIPTVRRVAYLTAQLPIPPAVDAAAKMLSLTLLPEEVAAPERFEHAFASLSGKRVDAVMVGDGWFFQGNIPTLARLAAQRKLPAMYRDRLFVEGGGLISYGPDWADLFRRAPIYVDRILRGAKPGDLPIEQPTKYELAINFKTAKALGLQMPQSLVERADEVIQ
jgi:putative ABC transport system substrate-binding protein